MRKVLCICEVAPRFKLDTRIFILLHSRESKRPTNTGRLLALALDNIEVRIRGDKLLPMRSDGLVSDDRETLLFFPSDKSEVLTAELIKSIAKPINFIVPDGSWRQAAKVSKREPSLKNVRHVRLPSGPNPKLRLRKETKTGGLSTFEAVARALGIIESDRVQNELEDFYKILAERTLWSRAKLHISECETEIPYGAYDHPKAARKES